MGTCSIRPHLPTAFCRVCMCVSVQLVLGIRKKPKRRSVSSFFQKNNRRARSATVKASVPVESWENTRESRPNASCSDPRPGVKSLESKRLCKTTLFHPTPVQVNKWVRKPSNVLSCVCVSNSGMQKGVHAKSVLVRAAHPHENIPGGVEVSSNPPPIVLSKGARNSDP